MKKKPNPYKVGDKVRVVHQKLPKPIYNDYGGYQHGEIVTITEFIDYTSGGNQSEYDHYLRVTSDTLSRILVIEQVEPYYENTHLLKLSKEIKGLDLFKKHVKDLLT